MSKKDENEDLVKEAEEFYEESIDEKKKMMNLLWI